MKILIGLVFCSVVVLVTSEDCLTASNCHHVTCASGHDLDCHNFHCTCSDTSQKCSGTGDCSGPCNRGWHCIDTVCRCGYGFGIPGIGK